MMHAYNAWCRSTWIRLTESAFMQIPRASKQEASDASERNRQLAQRMRDALAANTGAFRSLKQDTMLFRHALLLFCHA